MTDEPVTSRWICHPTGGPAWFEPSRREIRRECRRIRSKWTEQERLLRRMALPHDANDPEAVEVLSIA
jgi:hypothetical protein